MLHQQKRWFPPGAFWRSGRLGRSGKPGRSWIIMKALRMIQILWETLEEHTKTPGDTSRKPQTLQPTFGGAATSLQDFRWLFFLHLKYVMSYNLHLLCRIFLIETTFDCYLIFGYINISNCAFFNMVHSELYHIHSRNGILGIIYGWKDMEIHWDNCKNYRSRVFDHQKSSPVVRLFISVTISEQWAKMNQFPE